MRGMPLKKAKQILHSRPSPLPPLPPLLAGEMRCQVQAKCRVWYSPAETRHETETHTLIYICTNMEVYICIYMKRFSLSRSLGIYKLIYGADKALPEAQQRGRRLARLALWTTSGMPKLRYFFHSLFHSFSLSLSLSSIPHSLVDPLVHAPAMCVLCAHMCFCFCNSIWNALECSQLKWIISSTYKWTLN